MEDATLTYRAGRGWRMPLYHTGQGEGGGCHFNIQDRERVEDATLTYRAGRGWRMPL